MTTQRSADAQASFLRELFLAGCALAGGVATAVLLAYAEIAWGLTLYSWMAYLLVPAGAIVAGAAAAAGLYGGARLVGARPGWIAAFAVVVSSFATFFLLHYAEYRWLEADGVPLRQRVTFARYLDLRIQSTSLEIDLHGKKGRTDRLDELGYVVAGLQLLGFALGGFVVFASLRKRPYCPRCALLVARPSVTRRSTNDRDVFRYGFEQVSHQFDLGALDGIRREHAAMGTVGWRPGDECRSALEVRACPACPTRWVRLTTQHLWFGKWETSEVAALLEEHGSVAPL